MNPDTKARAEELEDEIDDNPESVSSSYMCPSTVFHARPYH